MFIPVWLKLIFLVACIALLKIGDYEDHKSEEVNDQCSSSLWAS